MPMQRFRDKCNHSRILDHLQCIYIPQLSRMGIKSRKATTISHGGSPPSILLLVECRAQQIAASTRPTLLFVRENLHSITQKDVPKNKKKTM